MMQLRQFASITLCVMSIAYGSWAQAALTAPSACVDALTQALTRNPVETYEQILATARASAARGEDSFEFEQGRSTLRKILADLQSRSSDPAFADLTQRATTLAQAPLRYHPFWRFVLDYIQSVDRVVRAEHPELTSRYNEGLAAHLFEPFLARAPRAILFPSFDSVDLEYFLASKAVPVYLIGLVTQPTHADGYLLSPLEFFMHDLGHSDYMAVRDLQVLDNKSVDTRTRLRRWSFLARHLKLGRDRLRQKDPDLADAVQMLLFEILHERGFSYDVTSLRLETDTEKWTDVVRRKYASVFFRGATDLNKQLFPRLTEARLWIGRQLRLLSEYESAPLLRFLRRNQTPVTLVHTPRADYFHGTLQAIEITPDGKMTARFETPEGVKTTELYYNVSLAQVDAIQPSPLTPEVIRSITSTLAGGLGVQLDPQGVWSSTARSAPPKSPVELSSLHLFKINQLLGLHARGVAASFSVPQAEQSYTGRIVRVTGLLGHKKLVVETERGQIELPVAETTFER